MRKELILVFVLLLVLASCQEGTTTTGREKAFIGGTTGLLINFVDGEPPAEGVTDGGSTPFTVSVKLENQGEAVVAANDLHLTIRGIDARSFGLSDSSQFQMTAQEDVLGNDINPDTGALIASAPVFVTFPELNFNGVLAGNNAFPLAVDVCYKYQTLATAELCIKENLLDASDEICKVSGAKVVQNSGAPVQVISFEEFSAGQNALSFSFTVKNVGNGNLAAAGTTCDETSVNKDYVALSIDTKLSGLTCSGLSEPSTSGTAVLGKVKLTTGERSIRCTQQLTEGDKTDKVMLVDFMIDYDYEETKQTTLLVKHI